MVTYMKTTNGKPETTVVHCSVTVLIEAAHAHRFPDAPFSSPEPPFLLVTWVGETEGSCATRQRYFKDE